MRSDKVKYMVAGMDMLLREFNKYPNKKEFTVEEIIGISNTVYFKITEEDNSNDNL